MAELTQEQKDAIKKATRKAVGSVFSIPVKEFLSLDLKNTSGESVIESAAEFIKDLSKAIVDHFGDENGKLIIDSLNELSLAELVKASQIIYDGIDSNQGKREIELQLFGREAIKSEALESLRSIIPTTAVINTSKVALQIIDNFANEGGIALRVSRNKAKKEFDVIASLDIEDKNIKITGRQPYTAYDRAVLNGICSLWQAGNTAFTPTMVYLAMNGLSGSDERGRYVSPQAVGAVTRSIEKQRVTRLTIDCTEQMNHYKDLKHAKYDSMMLSLDGVEMTAQNGTKVKAYTFTNPKRPPILYEYSRSIGQVLSVPPRLLNSSGTIRSTEEIIVIREYLIRRIEGMKGKNALRSNRIAFEAIYKELGIDIDALTGTKKRDTGVRIRKNTGALLEHLKSEGFIKSAKEYKDGRTIAGVEIGL